MGLEKYRSYKDKYVDDGLDIGSVVLEEDFSPDFHNRNTIQVWNVNNATDPIVRKWVGNTLKERSLHEISIVNNSGAVKKVYFDTNYHLVDEVFEEGSYIEIGPSGVAYFYATAILVDNNLVFSMRTGSQDKRNL